MLIRALRLAISLCLSYLTYAAIGSAIDKLSEHFERDSVARNSAEIVLAIMSPMAFGFVILALLVAVCYFWLVPRWIPITRPNHASRA
jgi:hypothetical protein